MKIHEKAGWLIAAAILLVVLFSVRPWRMRTPIPAASLPPDNELK